MFHKAPKLEGKKSILNKEKLRAEKLWMIISHNTKPKGRVRKHHRMHLLLFIFFPISIAHSLKGFLQD